MRLTSQPQEHGVEAHQTQCLAIKLSHLPEHVCLLDALHDAVIIDTDEVEEAGLEGALGGWRTVQPPGCSPQSGAMGDGNAVVAKDLR